MRDLNLPPEAKLFSADATSMYTNIDTLTGVTSIKLFLSDNRDNLPDDFPTKLYLHIVHIVMENNVSNEFRCLQEKINSHYTAYNTNSNYVLPRHQYLFTQHSPQQRQSMSYDGMTCWLRSVDEAHSILSFQEQHLRQTSQRIFSLFRHTDVVDDLSSTSTNLSYVPSLPDDAFLTEMTLDSTSLSSDDWSTSGNDNTMTNISDSSMSASVNTPKICPDSTCKSPQRHHRKLSSTIPSMLLSVPNLDR